MLVVNHNGGSNNGIYLVVPDTSNPKVVNIGGTGQANWTVGLALSGRLTITTSSIPYWSVSISRLAHVGSIVAIS